MTLKGVIAAILRYFIKFDISLQANYVTVVEDKPIMSAKYCLPVTLAKTDPHISHAVSATAKLLVGYGLQLVIRLKHLPQM